MMLCKLVVNLGWKDVFVEIQNDGNQFIFSLFHHQKCYEQA